MGYAVAPPTIAVMAALAFAPAAQAQSDYPNRPVQLLVGFTAGSASDLTARVVADSMKKFLGQPVVVLNRPGAGATIAATEAARAANDGYTLFLTSSAIAASMAFRPELKFDMKKDFAAIAPINNVPLILVVNPSLGVKNVKELVALAKSKPGELTYGSPGIGTGTHLGAELFALRYHDGEWPPFSPRSQVGAQPFPAAYVGNEALDGEDVTLWYVAHVHYDQSFPYTAGPWLKLEGFTR